MKSEYTRLLDEMEKEYHKNYTKLLTKYTKQLVTMQEEYMIAVERIKQEFMFGKPE